jgi:glycine dehydrogenase subunit 1
LSYLPHTEDEIRTMLDRIGLERCEDLFATVPESLRRRAELKLAPELDERALLRHFAESAASNLSVRGTTSFLGAGAYDHFIPSSVDALASRGEFVTAYTPYQAEISQGTLQAIYEFQTMLCQLLGLDVANASLYDGASATAEAALMSLRVTRRRRIYMSRGVHPHYRKVVETYTRGIGAELELLPLSEDGRTQLPTSLSGEAAAVILQSPNFFGCIEDLAALAEAAHSSGALAISTTAEALALALLRTPGDSGIDVACGEAQSFGVPISFGGPHVGFMAARRELVRNLPGRLIGETLDSDGRRAFVMTLTTREQHIRRERATSNICTNQALCALRVTIYLALMGKRGLRRLAEINLSLSSYARRELSDAGLRIPYAAPTFNEFVVEVPNLSERLQRCAQQGIQPGVSLGDLNPELGDRLLVCTTEMNDREQIDRLVRVLR